MKQATGHIIDCPHCASQYRVPFLIPLSFQSGNTWSDGYNSSRPECKLPGITRCDNCLNYFWINFDYLPAMHSPLSVKNLPDSLPYTRRLNAYELAEVIAGRSFKNPGTETYLRKLLWWTINDIYRYTGNPVVDTSMKTLFEENLESLSYKNPCKIPDNHLQLAEIFRELNQYDKALHWLNQVEAPSLDHIVIQLKSKIEDQDSRVFLLEDKVR